jgi:CheY-specific phosphatase CheX
VSRGDRLGAAAIAAFLADARGALVEAIGLDAFVDVCPSESDGGLLVVIHVRGDLSGVSWRIPTAVATRLAEVMAPGIEIDAAMHELAAAELANILTGRGVGALALHGLTAEIEPPELAMTGERGLVVVLATELGAIEVAFHEPIDHPPIVDADDGSEVAA